FSLRGVSRYWRAYSAYLICALLFLAVFFLIMTPQQSFSQTQRHLWDNILRTCDINGFYLKELFYPVDPLFIFPLQVRHSIIRFIFGALAFCAAGYAVWNIRRVPSPVAFGIIWFFIWLAPMNNFFSSFRVAMALRYLYLPLPGFAAVIAYPLWRIWSRSGCFSRWKNRFLSYLLPAAVAGSLIMFCIPSNLNWRSEPDLYLALEKKYPGSPFSQLGLGIILARHGQYAEAEKRFTSVFNAGWDIHKNDLAGVYRTLGDIYLRSGRYAAAEPIFRKMTELFPEAAIVWSDLGGCCALEGRYDQAQGAFQRAKILQPRHIQAYLKAGLVYFLNGEYQRAREEFLRLRDINAGRVYPEYDDIAYSLLLEKCAQKPAADNLEQAARIKKLKFFIWKGENR
ncbi:MAG: tetratricopeptide repeat protein, partial [Candidatus Omnitrophota bacterium]